MSRKAVDDADRLRRGLLVWGRELKGRWTGHGHDYAYAAHYVVSRSNDTGRWHSVAPGGQVLATTSRTRLLAQEVCQGHYAGQQTAPPADEKKKPAYDGRYARPVKIF